MYKISNISNVFVSNISNLYIQYISNTSTRFECFQIGKMVTTLIGHARLLGFTYP